MRVVTLNLWGAHEPLGRRLDAAAAGLVSLAPDAVLLQEVREGTELENTARSLARRLGGDWHTAYHCATRAEAGAFGPGSGAGEEGLAILARAPLADARSTLLPFSRPDERRILLSARLGEVWLHTTHLHYRMSDGVAREAQVVAANSAARACGGGVHVCGGDFNAPPDADEIRFLTGRHTIAGERGLWQDAFARLHGDARGLTWARRNPMTEALPFLERDRRIDFIFVSQEQRDGRGRVLDCRVVLDEPIAGTWPSDHFGVLAEVAV